MDNLQNLQDQYDEKCAERDRRMASVVDEQGLLDVANAEAEAARLRAQTLSLAISAKLGDDFPVLQKDIGKLASAIMVLKKLGTLD